MTRHEIVRLEREGATAFERGRAWYANPYLRAENMPARTGEPLRTWAERHDAWQRGYEACARGPHTP